MKSIGVPTERDPDEPRVALAPDAVERLTGEGFEVLVQRGAGEGSHYADEAYEQAGARLVNERSEVLSGADLVLRVRALGADADGWEEELEALSSGQGLMATCEPLDRPEPIARAAEQGLDVWALERIPRITRAQSMDVLSSMASLAGYKSVILAADTLPHILPMMMTAAGTMPPARVFVLGAGVAGLQAMATAKRLGATVEAYDIRSAAKEQVESVGAQFVELDLEAGEAEDEQGYARAKDEDFYAKQRELLAGITHRSDVVITTAAVPGKPAPKLIDEQMVRDMRSGSVVVDVVAARGGNCSLTRPGANETVDGVVVMGPDDLAARVPRDASWMFSRNVTALLRHLFGGEELEADDPIHAAVRVAGEGRVLDADLRSALGLEADAPAGSGAASTSTSEEAAQEAAEGEG